MKMKREEGSSLPNISPGDIEKMDFLRKMTKNKALEMLYIVNTKL